MKSGLQRLLSHKRPFEAAFHKTRRVYSQPYRRRFCAAAVASDQDARRRRLGIFAGASVATLAAGLAYEASRGARADTGSAVRPWETGKPVGGASKPERKAVHDTGGGGKNVDVNVAPALKDDEIMDKFRTERHEYRLRSMKVFAGTANIPLAEEIAKMLNVNLGEARIRNFADGEIGIQVLENVRGKDVYLVQPTCPPGVNDHLVELILLISTMRRASARTITAVIPYYGYARQDRKMTSRVPISAADVAKLLESMGVDRVVALDLHCGQIQGFFGPRTPCDNLDGSVVALPYFANLGLQPSKTIVVSPDAGGVYRAKRFRDGLRQQGLDAGLAMIVKQREKANSIAQMDLVGDVEGCDCIIVDDMIDTGGTLCKAGSELKSRGANRIFAFATHGMFNGPAIDRIHRSDFEKVVVTNSIPLEPKKHIDKIEVISVARLLADSIYSIHFRESLSKLFDRRKVNLTPDILKPAPLESSKPQVTRANAGTHS